MADNVSYKAYLRGSPMATLGSDTGSDPEIRRFLVDKDVSTSLQYLKSKIGEIFPRIRNDVYEITWVDADGDRVIIGSDEELIIALTEMTGPVYKLDINVKPKLFFNDGPTGTTTQGSSSGAPHPGVACDSCELEPINGFRYKCVVCPDYDLCGDCEAKGRHPGHTMLRMSTPDVAWPSHLLRRLNKAHDRIHKRAADRAERASSANHEEAVRQNHFPDMENGAWVHGFGGRRGMFGGRGGPGGRGRSCGAAGGPGPSHRHVWDSMMKGWSAENGGGCKGNTCTETKTETSTNTTTKEETREKTASAAQGRQQQRATPTSPMGAIDDLLKSFLDAGASYGPDYLKNVGEVVAAALDPLGVDVQVDIEQHGKRTTVGKPEAAEEATEEKKEPLVDSEKEKNPASESSSNSDDDEWTVVPKKDVAESVSIPVTVTTTSTTTNDNAADGFEVPINVSDKPAKVLFADTDGTLYPELPKREETPAAPAVAVPEPVAAETLVPVVVSLGATASAPKKEETVVEVPITVQKKKPSAPVAVHDDPKIQVALQAMLNMGFTNDGGWLTQLLESKEGDIGKTLDVLQPVRPNVR